MALADNLLAALEPRIERDVSKFDDSKWYATKLGVLYKGILDPDIQKTDFFNALKDSFSPVLDTAGRPLSQEGWDLYFTSIDAKMTPVEAIQELLPITAAKKFRRNPPA